MITARYKKYILNFKTPAGTSRGVLTEKETWFIILNEHGKYGVGECGLLRGLSVDDRADYEEKLRWTSENIHLGEEKLYKELVEFPSIQFGIETAFLSLRAKNPFIIFSSKFTDGEDSISINGLIWMDTINNMRSQISTKIKAGFTCLKIKIGALDFDNELMILKEIRNEYSREQLEIRVDANGNFDSSDALDKMKQLTGIDIHSIEQPVAINHTDTMAVLAKSGVLPIALDEQLIGVFGQEKKRELLERIKPQYIVLKPSFVGGFRGCREWISIAESMNIGWWITSALESNIGLNAISQFTYSLKTKMPQGLGTGSLYINNFDSPLQVCGGRIYYVPEKPWSTSKLILEV